MTSLKFTAADATGECVRVTNAADKSSIVVYRQGAHLTSWTDAAGTERLYTSPTSVYKPGKAIRGGVPLIFPQFSDLGPLKQSHGFLRTSERFTIESDGERDGVREVTFAHRVPAGEEPLLPGAAYTLLYTIAFTARALELRVSVANDGAAPLEFSFAFHSYFAVGEVAAVGVSGLDDTPYLEDLEDRKRCPPAPIHAIDREVDRIYLGQGERPVVLKDGAAHTLTITGHHLPDAVLWNPWIEKARGMSDLPDEDYHKFVCVEHGVITTKVTLAPQERWEGAQKILSQ